MIIPTKTQAGFIDTVTRLIQNGYTWTNGDTDIYSSLWEVYEDETAIKTNDDLRIFGYIYVYAVEEAEGILKEEE